jgi:hypothetical protein
MSVRISIKDDETAWEGVTEIGDAEALALAQLCKRITITDMRSHSADEQEADVMSNAIHLLRVALKDAGFNPR